jgi:hypothetical protein
MIPSYSNFLHLIKDVTLLTNIRRNDITKVKMKFDLIDDSILFLSEVTIQETQWFEYGYQWINSKNELIIRWDNTPHHSHIPTFPFHQHIGSSENIHPSEPMTLEKVLTYIESVIA